MGSTRALRSNTSIPTQPSAQALFYKIKNTILNTNNSVDLEFPDIPPEIGSLLTASFAEDPELEDELPRISFNPLTRTLTARVKPTRVLDCVQHWLQMEILHMMRDGFMSFEERDVLALMVGTRLHAFSPPYSMASKEPDLCILPEDLPLSTAVVECGWSESWPRLLTDKDLWLIGGPGVEVVILVRWTKLAGNHVKGDLQLYGRNTARNPVLLQEEPIFPAPPNALNQTLSISRGQLYGSTVPPGRDGGDIYPLSIENFREKARPSMTYMGFTPAT